MAVANVPFIPTRESQESIIRYAKLCLEQLTKDPLWRNNLRQMDLAYLRENDRTKENVRAKAANRAGNTDRIQNVTLPVVMPQVESAVTYQTSVFLTGVPLFGCESDPANIDAAKQLETVLDSHAIIGGFKGVLIKAMRNAFKYNFGPVEVAWETKKVPAFDSSVLAQTGGQEVTEVVQQGNVLNYWNPYNTFWDSRVPVSRLAEEGEFVGHTIRRSRTWLKSFIQSLPYHIISNVVPAFSSGEATGGASTEDAYYEPELNPERTHESANKGNVNWSTWFGQTSDQKIKYSGSYDITTLYARILPSELNMRVPAENTPQIWKFIIVNHMVVIFSERQTNAHNSLPVLIMQPHEDGLEAETKSLAANARPFQDIGSSLWNSVLAARRRAISDRGLFDPSRVDEKHINSANPSAKIPVKPSAYGKPLSEAYYPIPFRDDQSGILMQEIQQLGAMADKTNGQNPARQGQFVKGNKTQHEFSSVMANANGRDQTISIFLEDQFFTPLKNILRLNVLQYQGAESLYSRQLERNVQVDPIVLRNSVLSFKMTDGQVPADKVLSREAFQAAVQTVATSPQINAEYNLAPMFSYLMKSQGANLQPFEKSPEQKAYEQALSAWQQAIAGGIEKGVPAAQLPPQPMPQQFNYTPGQVAGAPMPETQVKNYQNNITNNVTGRE